MYLLYICQMKKTLVIHPKDKTTDFLKPIYDNIYHKTIINGGMTQEQLHEEINKYERIIMLGHGSPNGLFNMGDFVNCGYIINHKSVEYLKGKENIFIWCNADSFVKKYELSGLYSGMFISDFGEATLFNKDNDWTEKCIVESNDKFADILGKSINTTLDNTHLIVTKEYGKFGENNSIASYNNERLYYR